MNKITKYRSSIIITKICSVAGLMIILMVLYKFSVMFNVPEYDIQNSNYQLADDAYDINISNFTLKTLNNEDNHYTISANTARKISEDNYLLKDIYGTYKLDDGILSVKANAGQVLDGKNITLTNVVVLTLKEMELITNLLNINMQNNLMNSNEMITVHYKNSNATADNLAVDMNNSTIKLKGNVKAKFDLSDF